MALVGWENLEVVASVINNDVRQYNNTWYNVKIMLCNNDIYAKVWRVDQGEPDWQISYAGPTSYGNHLLLGGIYGHQNEKFYFDDIIVFIRGDANGDGLINISDVVHLINYLFVAGSPAPDPFEAGDANCDWAVDIADAVYIISYLFIGGPPPGC